MDNKPLIVATIVVGSVALFGLTRRSSSQGEAAAQPATAQADAPAWTSPTVEAAEARVLQGLEVTGYFNGYDPMVVSKEHFDQSVPVGEHLFLLAEAGRGPRKQEAQYRLALILQLGLFQQPVDESGALHWYRIAAWRVPEAQKAAEFLEAKGVKPPEGSGVSPEI